MGEKLIFVLMVLLPLSIILTALSVRIFRVERKSASYLFIFAAIFAALTLIYFIFFH